MSENTSYDLVVIGGGPAGYAAAIRAGQLGKKVACVEMERAGGTCLNWGCIPTKALLKAAEVYESFKHVADFGLSVGKTGYDFSKVMARSRSVSDRMAKGIEFLFRKNKVDYIVGKAQVAAQGLVEIIEGSEKGRFLSTRNILLATGCKPRRLPGLSVDGKRVFTSREALAMKHQPKSIVIVGAGAIGVEFAYFLNAFGTKVTLVEMLPQILPVEDDEVAAILNRNFSKSGIQIRTTTRVENIQVKFEGVSMDLYQGNNKETMEVDAILLSIGVEPNLEGVLSSKVNLELNRGYLSVNDAYQTSVPGIYGAGDIIGPPWLAHVATYEAIQAVNGMFGVSKPKRVTLFPGCTYCHPQVASIGLTEKKAKDLGIDYAVGKFPFTASGKAVAVNAAEGFVKVITDKKYGEIIGAHIIGENATELIAEYGLAMNAELTIDDIHETIHAHPTLSEALAEAAAAVHNQAIHI
jgi:dihydrolipoamide dehydrogenase